MEATNTRSKNLGYYVKSAIGIAIMLLFGYLPAFGAVSPLGMKVIGVYLGLIFLWSTVDMIWPSFVGLFILGLNGYSTIGGLISSGWGNATNVYIALICIFAYFIIKAGVSDIMVKSIVSRKFAKGKPWLTSYLFLIAAYVVAAIVSLTPACLIVWSIFTKYAKELGYKKGDPYPSIIIVGICLSALMGFSVFPFNPPGSILVGMAQEAGFEIPFLGFFISAFIIGFGSISLYILIAKYLLRPDVSHHLQDYQFEKSEKMTKYQKQILFYTILWVVLLIVQSAFVATPVGAFLAQFGPVGITLAVLALMIFLRSKDGSPFVDFVEATRYGVIWPVFFLLTIAMTLGSAMADETLGIGESLTMVLDPLFNTEGGFIIFILLTTLISVFLTQIMYNHIGAMLMYSITIFYCIRLGIHPGMLVVVITLCSNASIILPSANPVAAFMHGMKDWVTAKEIYKYGIPLALAVGIISTLVWLIGGNILF